MRTMITLYSNYQGGRFWCFHGIFGHHFVGGGEIIPVFLLVLLLLPIMLLIYLFGVSSIYIEQTILNLILKFLKFEYGKKLFQ